MKVIKQDIHPVVTNSCFNLSILCLLHSNQSEALQEKCSHSQSLTMTIPCWWFEDSSAVTPVDISSKDGVGRHINEDNFILTLLGVVHGDDWGHVDHVGA